MSAAESEWFRRHPTHRYYVPETMLEAVKWSCGRRDGDTIQLIRALSDDYCAQIIWPLKPDDDVIDALFDLGIIERLIGEGDLLLLKGGGSVQ